MKKLFLLGILLFFTAFFTFADSWYVRANGNDNNSGLSEAAPFKTLAKAIQAASDGTVKTITVIGTLNHASENSTWDTTTVFPLIAKNNELITIRGKQSAAENEKAILSAKGTDRRVIFTNSPSNIHFEYIDITGGDITDRNGGGICIENAAVSIGTGTRFYDNSANAGGAIFITRNTEKRTVIQNAEIFDNTAKWGGGIYTYSEMLIEDTRIYNNYASNYGGGVEIDGKGAIIKNSTITGNRTGTSGGGIYVAKDADIELINCSINENEASGGGGIGTSGAVLMSGGTINNNNVRWGSGGGIKIDENGSFTMSGGYVSGNTSLSSGGGIYIDKNGSFTMSGGYVSGNTSPNSTGGGIYIEGKCIIEDGVISNNRAGNESNVTNGGGISVSKGAEFSMNGGSIENNIASYSGGGIYTDNESKVQLSNVVLKNNRADNGGGMAVATELEIINCSIISNFAKRDGGGVLVFVEGGLLIMRGGEAYNNHSGERGGAFDLQGPGKFYSVKIRNNQSVWGGGIRSPAVLHLQDSILSGNRAFHGAGVLLLGQGSSTIVNCEFNRNFAFYSGAAIGIQGSVVLLDSSKITGNKTIDGGGIFLGGGGSLTINGGTIALNTANQGNGIFYEKGTLLRQSIVDINDLFEEK